MCDCVYFQITFYIHLVLNFPLNVHTDKTKQEKKEIIFIFIYQHNKMHAITCSNYSIDIFIARLSESISGHDNNIA